MGPPFSIMGYHGWEQFVFQNLLKASGHWFLLKETRFSNDLSRDPEFSHLNQQRIIYVYIYIHIYYSVYIIGSIDGQRSLMFTVLIYMISYVISYCLNISISLYVKVAFITNFGVWGSKAPQEPSWFVGLANMNSPHPWSTTTGLVHIEIRTHLSSWNFNCSINTRGEVA